VRTIDLGMKEASRELKDVIVEAWLARAPERLVKEYLAATFR